MTLIEESTEQVAVGSAIFGDWCERAPFFSPFRVVAVRTNGQMCGFSTTCEAEAWLDAEVAIVE